MRESTCRDHHRHGLTAAEGGAQRGIIMGGCSVDSCNTDSIEPRSHIDPRERLRISSSGDEDEVSSLT
jgi:hypothetical protein